jgi:hypothetical protein
MSDRRFAIVAALSLFVVSFFAFAFLFLRFPLIYDTDSYFHLAAARLYATDGLVHSLPWARMSVMHQGYGDKELLFHLALSPFTRLTDAAVGGRLALALLNASLFALLAWLGVSMIGRWGAIAPLLVYAGASPFFARAIRLRPELFALMLLIAATWFATRRRYLFFGVAVFLFTLSYTAFQVLVALAFLWFAWDGVGDIDGNGDYRLPRSRAPDSRFSPIPSSRRTSRSGGFRTSRSSSARDISMSATRFFHRSPPT